MAYRLHGGWSMNQRLTFAAISVSDLDRSLRFYRDILGLPLTEESHDSDLGDPWYGGPHAAHSWTDGALDRNIVSITADAR